MNYHLENSKTYQAIGGKPVTNFSGDIKDSKAYACLLEQIQPRDEETNEYTLIPAIDSNDVNVSNLVWFYNTNIPLDFYTILQV